MLYTLSMFFVWGLVMAAIGVAIGWLLRSLKSRGRSTTADEQEVEQLRHRLADLEPVVEERDRLRMELADVRGSSAGALGFSSPADPDDDELDDR